MTYKLLYGLANIYMQHNQTHLPIKDYLFHHKNNKIKIFLFPNCIINLLFIDKKCIFTHLNANRYYRKKITKN